MAINKAISSVNAVIQAKEEMGLEGTTRFDGLFKLWVKQCDERIGITESSLCAKVIKTVVSGCRIELDCDVVAVYPTVFFTEIACDDCATFAYGFHKQNGANVIARNGLASIYFDENNYHCSNNEYKIVDNKIVFPIDGYHGKTVWLICLTRRKDDQGYIYTHPEYIRPMIEYVTMRMMKRARFTGVPYKFSLGEQQAQEYEYHKQVRNAVANSASDSPEAHSRIGDLINNAFSGSADVRWVINYDSNVASL